MFGLAGRLFGVSITPADGEAEVWNPDVRFFNIKDTASGGERRGKLKLSLRLKLKLTLDACYDGVGTIWVALLDQRILEWRGSLTEEGNYGIPSKHHSCFTAMFVVSLGHGDVHRAFRFRFSQGFLTFNFFYVWVILFFGVGVVVSC